MRRVFLALVCLVSGLVAGCGLVRQGLPMEAQDAAPTGVVSRADAGRDAFRALDAGGDRPTTIDPPPSPTQPPVQPPTQPPVMTPNLRGVGAVCEASGECASGHCVDGVCCGSACDGVCEACDVAGTLGSCVAVTGAPRGKRPPCVGQGTVCAGRCDGEQPSFCRYPAGDTECAAAACTAGLATTRAVCSGGGVCLPPSMVNCAPFSCSGAICAGGCGASSPCLSGNFCSGGRCLPLGAAGSVCAAGNECQSGFCVDGRCCNRACTAACEACDRPGQLGTCGAMSFSSDVNHCGGCGSRCSANHIRAQCQGGNCLGACEGGFADCNGNKRSDGCEVNVSADAQNCGACGARCPGTRCLAGACEKIELEFSIAGPIAGRSCISLDEPSDPHFWSDNYLCTQRDFGLRWSIIGQIPGQVCTQINEPSDPHFWADNFLCAPVDYGLRWSFVGPIEGMRCTAIDEPSDPDAWIDNFLCAPP